MSSFPWGPTLLAVGVGWLVLKKPNLDMVQGHTYQAVFEVPPTAKNSVAQLQSVFPAGASLLFDARGNLVVTFIAPRTAELTDVPTPIGTLRVISLKEVS